MSLIGIIGLLGWTYALFVTSSKGKVPIWVAVVTVMCSIIALWNATQIS